MLFLAVFCGFLAENEREHYVEHQREKQYANELYDEFFADSIAAGNKLMTRLDKERDCDYLKHYLKEGSYGSHCCNSGASAPHPAWRSGAEGRHCVF